MRFDRKRWIVGSMIARRWVLMTASLVALASLGVACGGGDDGDGDARTRNPRPVTFVGTVAGTEAYVAFVTNGEQVAGYLCDGADVSVWFAPTDLDDGTAALTRRDGTRVGSVTLGGGAATGEVTLAGAAGSFRADAASGSPGLYRASRGEVGAPASVEVGWIVLHDGTQRGATNNFIQSGVDLIVDPAPTLTPGAGTVQVGTFGALPVERLGRGFVDSEIDF